jgi:hypothetical protein
MAFVDYVEDEDALKNWIKNNRAPLNFTKSNKHGENGKGAHASNKGKPVSLLLCSCAEAQELLNDAIQDQREDEKRLFNYDLSKRKYIVFYDSGDSPQYEYHGFHLDESDVNTMIPNKILSELKEKFNI